MKFSCSKSALQSLDKKIAFSKNFPVLIHGVFFPIFYRDAGIIAIGHFVWSILCVLFVFSLIGVVSESKVINADQFDNPKDIVSVTGTGIWLITSTLAESAIQGMY